MNIAINGFLVGLSLIVAIGPQNALLIKQGVKRTGVTAVVLVCLISDILLIFGGTLGVGVIITQAPIVMTVMKWAGLSYILYFAYTCFRDAFRPPAQGIIEEATPEPMGSGSVVGAQGGVSAEASGVTTLAPETRIKTQQRAWIKPALAALTFTWLNPVAYIDAVVLLGGLANQFGEYHRWLFAAGAFAASFAWFPTVGYGAKALSGVLSSPRIWQFINFGIGVIMLFISYRLFML